MKHTSKVIAILPAYNAKNTFKEVVDALPKGVIDEIILSDDCSSDNTYEVARSDKRLIVLKTPQNLGYGGNLKFCLSHALDRGADIIIEIHPDGEYKTDGIVPAIQKVQKGANLVLGNRFLGSNKGMYAWKNAGTRVLSAIDRVVLQTSIGDLHQGFRVYTRELLESVAYKTYSNNYLFSFEIIVDALQSGHNVEEVPVSTSYTGKKRGALPRAAILYALQTFGVLLLKQTRIRVSDHQSAVRCPICHTTETVYSKYTIDRQYRLYYCYACGCGITTPRSIDLSTYYQADYYNQGSLSKIKSWVYNIFQQRRVSWLTRYVTQHGHVVDVGAGDGAFGKTLGTRYTTTSLEAPFANLQTPDVIKTSILNHSMTASVNAVVLWESLEHMEDPDAVISHVSGWVKKQGYVFVEYPRFDSVESRIFGSSWYHLDIPRHRIQFTTKGLRSLLNTHGFDVVEDRSVWALEYAIVGFAASMLGWSATDLSKRVRNPFWLCIFCLLLPVSCLCACVLAILGQSPISLLVAKKRL